MLNCLFDQSIKGELLRGPLPHYIRNIIHVQMRKGLYCTISTEVALGGKSPIISNEVWAPFFSDYTFDPFYSTHFWQKYV